MKRSGMLFAILVLNLCFLGIHNPAVATTLSGVGTESQGDEAKKKAVKDYLQSCRGAKKTEKECLQIRPQALAIVKDDLLTLGSSADKAKLPVLAKVLGSDEAELRAAAADAIGMIRPTREVVPTLVKALNDPVPQVRYSVRTALESKSDPDRAADALIRRSGKDGRKDMEPESPPKEDRLGVPVYRGATFLYYASDIPRGKAAFATSDSAESVLKFYAAAAKRSPTTLEQFNQTYKGEPDESAQARMGQAMMERMMKAVQEGKNPQELQAEMMRGMSTEVPTREYNDKEIFEKPAFLVLEESDLGGFKSPVRFVVVFADRALNQTGFVLHVPVELPKMDAPSSSGSGRQRKRFR